MLGCILRIPFCFCMLPYKYLAWKLWSIISVRKWSCIPPLPSHATTDLAPAHQFSMTACPSTAPLCPCTALTGVCPRMTWPRPWLIFRYWSTGLQEGNNQYKFEYRLQYKESILARSVFIPGKCIEVLPSEHKISCLNLWTEQPNSTSVGINVYHFNYIGDSFLLTVSTFYSIYFLKSIWNTAADCMQYLSSSKRSLLLG